MLTDRNKEQFEKWLLITFYGGNKKKYDRFLNYDFPEQLGVYLAYADSLGYDIEVLRYSIYNTLYGKYYEWVIHISNDEIIELNKEYETRPEAQKAALKAFDKLINKEV